jgi:hypothetical protein
MKDRNIPDHLIRKIDSFYKYNFKQIKFEKFTEKELLD